MQRNNNPYLSVFNTVAEALLPYVVQEFKPTINPLKGTIMSVFSKRQPVPHINGPVSIPVSASNLKVGDVINIPVTQRLVIKEITSASDGAVVVGVPMLVLQCEGHEGVFHKLGAAPIVVPMDAIVSTLSRPLEVKITE